MLPDSTPSSRTPRDFQFLVDRLPQLIWVTKPDGNHLYYNQRWYAYTGLDYEQSRDQGWRLVLHAEDYHRTLSVWQHALHSGEPYQIEYRLRRHDGTYRWFLGRALAERDQQGNILQWYGTCTDIEDQKRSQQALQESHQREEEALAEAKRQKERLERFLEEAPAIIVVHSGPNFVFEFINPRYQRVFPGRKLLGKPLLEGLPELAGTPVQNMVEHVYNTGETFYGKEVLIPLAPYEDAPLENNYYNFIYQARFDEKGKVDGIMVFAYDVTEQVLARKQVEQLNKELAATNKELAASNEELQATSEEIRATNEELAFANEQLTRTNVDLDTFVYTASHDLKAPILNIEGLLNSLQKRIGPETQQNQTVQEIYGLLHNSVNRFKATIQDLTDVARISKESAEDVGTIEIAVVLKEVLEDLEPQRQQARALIELKLDCPPVIFSRKNLKSVLYNLLSNALKYRSPDRLLQVRITCTTQADYRVLSVGDNGLGIDMRHEEKIFALFKRLHTHVEGTGIGLYMVKKMVENANGKIEVESQLGVGSTFRVYLKC